MTLIEQIKRDREAGTSGPFSYRIHGFSGDCGVTAPGCSVVMECFADIRHPGEGAREEAQANARRIARAHQMEAALLAAEELAEAASFLEARLLSFDLTDDADDMCREYIGHVEPAEHRMAAALTAYRKTTEIEG